MADVARTLHCLVPVHPPSLLLAFGLADRDLPQQILKFIYRDNAILIFLLQPPGDFDMDEITLPNSRDMEAALKDDTPGFARLFLLRGINFERKGDLIRAMDDYNTALRIDPDNAEILYIRGLAYCRKGALDQGIANFDAALRLDPAFAEALYARGNAYEKKRRFDRAAQDYDAVLRLLPGDERAMASRSKIALRLVVSA